MPRSRRFQPEMVPHRRRLLQAAAAATAALAGCNGLAGEESGSAGVSEGGATLPGGSSTETPETLLVRADTPTRPIRLGDPDGATPDRGERRRRELEILDSATAAAALTTADGVDADVEAFVAATDFDAETLLLQTSRVAACYRLRLCSVSWADDSVRTDYVRRLRPYDERCAADETVFESRLVRIPAAVDADAVSSYGSGVSAGGSCDERVAGAEGSTGSGSAATPAPTDGGGE